MKILVFVGALFVLSQSFAQRDNFRGIVLAEENGQALWRAHIANLTSRKLAVSDTAGIFEIPVKTGDTLFVSYIGFQSEIIPIDSPKDLSGQLVILKRSSESLDEVTVYKFPYYEKFKEILLEAQPSDSSYAVFGLGDIPIPEPERPAEVEEAFMGVSVGVRFDAGRFSRKERRKRKTKKKLMTQALHKEVAEKLTRSWFMEATSLEGDSLTNFIAYCRLEPEYVLRTPTYIIKERVWTLLTQYKAGLPPDD